jgi:hypothetical protein
MILIIFYSIGDKDNQSENRKIFFNFLELFSKNFPNLRVLYIGGNYFTKIPNYANLVSEALIGLKNIDGKFIEK